MEELILLTHLSLSFVKIVCTYEFPQKKLSGYLEDAFIKLIPYKVDNYQELDEMSKIIIIIFIF